MPKILSQKQLSKTIEAEIRKNKVNNLVSQFFKNFPQGELFLVGGIVRDILMNRENKGDLDFVVRNVQAKQLENFLNKFGAVNLVGKNFGVFKFKARNANKNNFVDFALPRTEHSLGTGAYRDFKIQSNPKLQLKDDLARRDFTINALAWDLKSKKLIDHFNGVNDLRAGLIRAVGQPKKRFLEDYSRMARALRFATELNFTIERRTWKALKKLIRLLSKKKRGEFIVPRETLAKEFLKSFAADPLQAFEWWGAAEAFDALVPEISALKRCAQRKEFHAEGNAGKHVHLALQALASDDFKKEFGQSKIPLYVSLGVLLHDIGKPKSRARKTSADGHVTFPGHASIGAKMTKQIVKRLKLESYKAAGIDIEAKKLAWLVENHMFILTNDPKETPWAKIEQYFMQKDFPKNYLLQISFCDIEGSKLGTKIPNLYRLNYLGYKERIRKLVRRFPQGLPKKLITGDDIKRVLKTGPGPKIARALDMLREEQLAGKIKTKSQALAYLKKEVA